MSHEKTAEEGEGTKESAKEEKLSVGKLDAKADELLWEYALRQDQHTYEQFSLGVVGIGALFFAYGSITTASLKGLVAVIGFAASLTLFDHMWGARQEYYCTRDELKG